MTDHLIVFRDRVELSLGDLAVGKHLGRLAVEFRQENRVLDASDLFAELGKVGIRCHAGLLVEGFAVHGAYIGTEARNFRSGQ